MKTFEPYIEERPQDLEVTIDSTDSKETMTIFLNKGSSFGSNHLTTKLIIDAIMSIDKKKEKDSTALDLGCGSGIITILLLKLKYKEIKSIDIDPYVLLEARQNILSNFGHLPLAVSLTDEEIHLLDCQFNLVAVNISGNFHEAGSVVRVCLFVFSTGSFVCGPADKLVQRNDMLQQLVFVQF